MTTYCKRLNKWRYACERWKSDHSGCNEEKDHEYTYAENAKSKGAEYDG